MFIILCFHHQTQQGEKALGKTLLQFGAKDVVKSLGFLMFLISGSMPHLVTQIKHRH